MKALKQALTLGALALVACQSTPEASPQGSAAQPTPSEREKSGVNPLSDEASMPPKRSVKIPAKTRGPKGSRPADKVRWAVPLDPTSPKRGASEDALVTMVLFEDLESPFSRHLFPTLERLFEGAPSGLRLSYRHLPLPHNAKARSFASAAHCAHEQGHFWQMRAALMRMESPELAGALASLKLDAKAYEACLASPRPERRIRADAQAAQRASVGGTPVLFVNGRKSAGSISFDALNQLIREERSEARKRASAQAKAVPRARLYEVITKNGRTRNPLAPVPTPVAEEPLVRLGEPERVIAIRAWLDLSSHEQRKSLRALIELARSDASVSLEFFPAGGGDKAEAQAWRRSLWCARKEGKAWPMLEAATAATKHSAGHPMDEVEHHEEHEDEDPLPAITASLGLKASSCAATTPKPATFQEATWLINGRRYDGSLGWGPPALRRLKGLFSVAP